MPLLFVFVACAPPCDMTDAVESGGDSSDSADSADTGMPPTQYGIAGLSALGVSNVFILHVDTLRADHLPVYGYSRDTLPQSSTVPWLTVGPVHSATSWTIPSTVSMLTAMGMESHGVWHMDGSGEFNAGVTDPTVAEHLADFGYDALMISGNEAIQGVDGVFSGFESLDIPDDDADSRDATWEVEQALSWIDARSAGTPFVAFVQPMNVHDPYTPGSSFYGTFSDKTNAPFDLGGSRDEQLTQLNEKYHAATTDTEREAVRQTLLDLYDDSILAIDNAVATAVAGLEERGLAADTLVVLTADHGETLMEESDDPDMVFFGHGGTVRQEVVRVPLLFHNPSLAAGYEDCLAENIDTMPTILNALGIEPMEEIDGQALQAECRGMARASVFNPDMESNEMREMLVTDGTSSLRWRCDRREIDRYDLLTDPVGLAPVAIENFPADATLTTEMQSFLADYGSEVVSIGCGEDIPYEQNP